MKRICLPAVSAALLIMLAPAAMACSIAEKTFRFQDRGFSGQVGFNDTCEYVLIRESGEQFFLPIREVPTGWEFREGTFSVHFSKDHKWMRYATEEGRLRVRLVPTN